MIGVMGAQDKQQGKSGRAPGGRGEGSWNVGGALVHWEGLQARARWCSGEMRGPWDEGWLRGPMLRGTCSVGSRQVLPSGLGSLELQGGRSAREDQGAPRKENRDSGRTF